MVLGEQPSSPVGTRPNETDIDVLCSVGDNKMVWGRELRGRAVAIDMVGQCWLGAAFRRTYRTLRLEGVRPEYVVGNPASFAAC